MSGNAILFIPYEIDWVGREEPRQVLTRAMLAHGADISRQFEGPSLSMPKGSLGFDVDVSRFVDQVRRLSALAAEPVPSTQYRPPSAFVLLAHSHPFDQRIVQLIQRLVSAAPGLGAAAFLLLCDFRADRPLGSALRSYGTLDREDPQHLPILTLSATRTRLLVIGHDIVYPLAELSGRIRALMTAERPRTGPRSSGSEPAFPAVAPPPSVPRRESGFDIPRIVLDPALRTGDDKK